MSKKNIASYLSSQNIFLSIITLGIWIFVLLFFLDLFVDDAVEVEDIVNID